VRSDLDWPNALQDVFDRALAPDPVDRFASVSDFGGALGDAVMEMTPSQTTEIYRHALGNRTPAVGARTPGDLAGKGTPASIDASGKAGKENKGPKRRHDPVAVRRRHDRYLRQCGPRHGERLPRAGAGQGTGRGAARWADASARGQQAACAQAKRRHDGEGEG
jgi:hypothetical protein